MRFALVTDFTCVNNHAQTTHGAN